MQNAEELPPGLHASATQCGIRRRSLDLGLIVADEPRPAAAIYTRSLLQGAHIEVCREHLAETRGRIRALLVNSGNANCSTGRQGVDDNRRICAALAELVGCAPKEVLFLSTGVIGERLPVERILDSLPALTSADAIQGTQAFAQAIMTTDMVPKVVSDRLSDGARAVGIGKGSGMIHPNMATMFGFLLTDASIGDAPVDLLRRVNSRSFQRMTVDGDTSPNDTVVLWGGNKTGLPPTDLEPTLDGLAQGLARRMASDGEGATRLVTVRVEGAPDIDAAVRVGRTIATSPLVKTAVHGRDPNWGRIVAAAGRAEVEFDMHAARCWIGDALLFSQGIPHPENENEAHMHMLQDKEILLRVDLARGNASADIWTCDFSSDYVRINADYRS
ncbi:MAG: bifunctional glutamate N-acetyltransferase/amino-acid acetyltransferase ArgJ [Planctomycetota bacterium]